MEEKSNNNEDENNCANVKPNICKVRYNRIFKKVSSDGNLVLFLPQRELSVSESNVESLMGVALIHENIMRVPDIKVFLQVVLIFRYGREDEELMGLRFCNEVIVAAEQIYPTPVEEAIDSEANAGSPKRRASTSRRNSTLVNNQGFVAVPFVVDMGSAAPPSIRLIPCRPYNGAPIGTSYEVQLFASHSVDELPRRRRMVQMSLRLYEQLPKELPPRSNIVVHKDYVFSDKPLTISAKLDKGLYAQGDEILLTLSIQRKDKEPHGVRKIKVMAMQQVSVAMFSTGNFKNNIGENTSFDRPDPNDSEYNQVIPIKIELGNDYAWAAMDETARKDAELTQLAPTVTHSNKCLFVVRVTYYLQVVVLFGLLKRPVAIKLPFLLKRTEAKKNEPAIILETSSSTKIVKKDSKSADDTEVGSATAQDDPNAEEVEEVGSKTQTDI